MNINHCVVSLVIFCLSAPVLSKDIVRINKGQSFKDLRIQYKIDVLEKILAVTETQFGDYEIIIKDYYFSNVVARSSKTMIECNNSKLNLKSTGTEG